MTRLTIVITAMLSLTLWSTGYTQTKYCLPYHKAVKIIEDAVKKRSLDSMVNNREDKIVVLNNQLDSQKKDFNEQLNIANQRTTEQEQIVGEFEQMVSQCHTEGNRLRKKVNRRTVTVYGLAALLLISIGVNIAQ